MNNCDLVLLYDFFFGVTWSEDKQEASKLVSCLITQKKIHFAIFGSPPWQSNVPNAWTKYTVTIPVLTLPIQFMPLLWIQYGRIIHVLGTRLNGVHFLPSNISLLSNQLIGHKHDFRNSWFPFIASRLDEVVLRVKHWFCKFCWLWC